MLDFPNSPSVGQTFVSGNTTWTWDGTKWLAAGTSGASSIYLPLAGGTLTGPLTVSAPTSHIDNAIIGATTPAAASITSLNGGQLAGMRNLIINGRGLIDQRNGGATTTPANVNNSVYVSDRWAYYPTQASKFSFASGSIGGFFNGARTAISASVAAAYTPVAADTFLLYQPIEGLNFGRLGWGTAGALPVTLSFDAYTVVAGTYCVSIINSGGARGYLATFAGGASTWQHVTVTIPGDTAGTWASDNTAGCLVRWCLGYGSNVVGAAGAWNSTGVSATAGSVNAVSLSNGYLAITNVQLEQGTVATPFESRLYGAELALCQRYYQRYVSGFQRPYVSGYANGAGGIGNLENLLLPVVMRAAPTVTQIGTWQFSNCTAVNFLATPTSVDFYATATAAGMVIFYANTSDGYSLNAEL
jgi:hypothetical protein